MQPLTNQNKNTSLLTQVKPSTQTVGSSNSITINADITSIFTVTALAVGATFLAPSGGNIVNGQKLIVRILDNGISQTISWAAGANGFSSTAGATLPAATTPGVEKYIGLIYNSVTQTWDCVAVS